MFKFALLAGLAAVSEAACPNQCSGHGRCSEFDKCVCYRQGGTSNPYRFAYTGPDCSQRTCPLGRAYDAVSTSASTVTSMVFKGSNAVTENKLQAFFIPTARNSNFADLRRDQKFVIRIMTAAVDPITAEFSGTFTWKFEEDEYFQRETSIASTKAVESARHLEKTGADGSLLSSGVFVYFDGNNMGANGWTNKDGKMAITAGDMYSFTLTHNEGYTFAEDNSNTAHQETECSGRGVCDYTAGKCQCFGGYTGEACQRTACPNSCSGHGACQSESRFVADAKVGGTRKFKYEGGYDGLQQYGCKCDAGYRGADCSQIECASGPDPMGGEGGAEGRDCSGRGLCDYTTGICKCFKGFYGGRCEGQTNFV